MRMTCVALAVFPAFLSAQSLTPQLVGSAGQSVASTNFDVEWSVGEPVIGPFDTAATTTFGYQQLDEQIVVGIVPPEAGLSGLRLQRLQGSVRLVFSEAGASYEVRVFNGQGRNLRRYYVSKGQKELVIPTKTLGAGAVMMNVYNQDKKNVQNFKFIVGEGQ